MRWKRSISVLASTGLLVLGVAVPARAASSPTVTVGVGHFDPHNFTRPFVSYADFFGREVRVHQGDVVDFQTQPLEFHAIGLAMVVDSRPLLVADIDDKPAQGTGLPKLAAGPTLPQAFSPPTCGTSGQQDCVFDGTAAVNAGGIGGFDPATGQPVTVDWNVKITAPTGDYNYFCYIHPGMQGTLHVVTPDQPSDTGEQITKSDAQFQQERTDAENLIASDTNAAPSGAPGSRTWSVHVGDTTSSRHATILAMMPASLPNVVSGDTVKFLWGALEVHTVGFGPEANLPAPFGWDCGKTYVGFGPNGPGSSPPPPCVEVENGQPEAVGDPGSRGPGQGLNGNQLTDSGLLSGSAYGVNPSAQWWSVAAAQPGTYHYHCTVHDFMQASISVTGS
jgi:plastocyanin